MSSIADEMRYMRIIAKDYSPVKYDGWDQMLFVHVHKNHPDLFLIYKSIYGNLPIISFIKTEVPNRLSFLIPKHCVFIKIQTAEQLKQLIDNAQ